MKTTVQYLDALKRRLDLPSDYAVAKVLGITRAAVSRYRQAGGAFDDLTAVRAAELLGLDPLEVIAASNAERARDDDARRVWERLWGKATGAAVTTAFAACIVGLAAAPSPAQSAPLEPDNVLSSCYVNFMASSERPAMARPVVHGNLLPRCISQQRLADHVRAIRHTMDAAQLPTASSVFSRSSLPEPMALIR